MRKYKEEEKVIYLLSPRHGNLGDQMIGIACKKIISDYYQDKKIIEIENVIWRKHKEKIDKIINKKDIIVLHGGGNLGDIWLNAELDRREVLEKYPNNKIIIMPQTITFKLEEEILKSKEIYSKVKNLTIITREESSYLKGKSLFSKNKIFLTPDSVLYLENEYINVEFEREESILFLTRKDQEKIVPDEVFKKILEKLDSKKIMYKLDDTVIKSKGMITKDTRIETCAQLINKIKRNKIVITDRLHGMILSVITNTPVLVFASSTAKTKGTLKWLKHLEYVSYIEENNLEKIEFEIDRLMKLNIRKKEYKIKETMKKIFEEIF